MDCDAVPGDRCQGPNTVVSLAVEAGVKRHVLTHKHTDLRDRFSARVKAHNGVATNHAALHQQNNELRRTLDHMRAEWDESQVDT